ncbi:hypothetical protein PILCRDRAFT_609535 [Piloderma croceum F 1598]|uniref:Secreted protein n=1 Tax=Piloderma croceum (strain F 1598) TaxID=765440 RepID=A0A0C3FDF7_PILCF|nr:hypothetical protein PILCRDRAFT_609535 [Piloderma croceum F 1598]
MLLFFNSLITSFRPILLAFGPLSLITTSSTCSTSPTDATWFELAYAQIKRQSCKMQRVRVLTSLSRTGCTVFLLADASKRFRELVDSGAFRILRVESLEAKKRAYIELRVS